MLNKSLVTTIVLYSWLKAFVQYYCSQHYGVKFLFHIILYCLQNHNTFSIFNSCFILKCVLNTPLLY